MKCHASSALLLVSLFAQSLVGQSPITFRYFYDNLNRLAAALDSTGTIINYKYDAAGNILQVTRSTVAPGALTLFNITPTTAPTGTTIIIQGQGFSATPSADQVTINGVALTVLSATSTTLVAQVPATATTGTISVTAGGVTVTSSAPETILPAPIILMLAPKATLAGTPFSLTVTGANLLNATFAFSPQLIITSATINVGGTSATLVVSPAASAMGYYTLIGTNTAGLSNAIPIVGFLPTVTTFNTISIPGSNPAADPDLDGLTNAQEIALGTDPLNPDTDGDSYPDSLEVFYGSDPLNPHSIPAIKPAPYFSTPAISILNSIAPMPPHPSTYALSGATFSLLNSASPASLQQSTYAISGATFSLLNSASPASLQQSTYAISGATFSLLNSASPASLQQSKYAISGATFSLLNSASPASLQQSKYAISGATFSLLNSASPASLQQSKYAISGAAFSLLNSASPASLHASMYAIGGPLFSILNGISPAPSQPTARFANSLAFSLLNGQPPSTPQSLSQHRSLHFRVPVDPAFIVAALARGRQTIDGKQVCLDSDGDGLCDADELIIGTNPFAADTDGDGYPDGLELALGSDPLDPNSVPKIMPPGYFVSRPASIYNIAPKPRAVLNRQGGNYAGKKK